MSNLESFTLNNAALPKVKVNSLVIFSILNSFMRRTNRDSRVIGTLLGEEKDGVVTISDCFAVIHKEKQDELHVEIHQDYHRLMYAFHNRNNKNEKIVGWYATTTIAGELIVDNSSLIHEFYSLECANPVHLVVDTTLLGDSIPVRGFVSKNVLIGEEVLANTFQEIAVKVALSANEITCVYDMLHSQVPKSTKSDSSARAAGSAEEKIGEGDKWADSEVLSRVPKESERIVNQLSSFEASLDAAIAYVTDVVEGRVPATRSIGVSLADALDAFADSSAVMSSLTGSMGENKGEAESVDVAAAAGASALLGGKSASNEFMQSKAEELMMASFLSSMVQTQIQISEKLNAIL